MVAATEITIEFEYRNTRYKDAEKGLRAFASQFEGGIERATESLSKDLRKFLDAVAQALAKRHGGAWPGGTSENSLSRRSGAGVQSILDSISVEGNALSEIRGTIGASYRMKIHEAGGIIKAKNVKYLTIPLRAALNSDGTPIKQKARDWDKTFVATSKAGNLIIFRREGRKIVPLYVLKEQVYIPPRMNMRKTLDAGLPYFVDTAMANMVKAITKGLEG